MKKTITKILAVNLLFVLKPIYADDIDVYIQKPSDPVPPNVLFVLDRSGSMSWGGHVAGGTRMRRLKTAMSTLLRSDKMKNVNAGIMSYAQPYNYWSTPMLMVSSFKKVGDHKHTMISAVNGIYPGGGTPTVPALDAALKWYQGAYFYQPSPFGYTPKNNWCKSNQIVLLSDGSPNSSSMTQFPAGTVCYQDPYQRGGRCSQEIARWARGKDFKTGSGWDIGLSEGKKQNIITHTIGFDTPYWSPLSGYLRGIATAGGGKFYQASSSADLLSAFSSIIKKGESAINYTYAAPVIPYNPDNTAVSGEYIYIPMLKPSEKIFWKGNLKKYKITNDSSGIIIKDKYNNSIIDTNQTFISSTDLWSTSADGGDALKNGAARRQDTSLSGSRKLYSNIDPSINNLTDITNSVDQANSKLTNGLLDVSNANDRTDVLSWVNWQVPNSGFLTGVDLLKGSMGASIHSEPVVATYSSLEGDLVLSSGSDGILKAIDADTGVELWGFMPKDLLQNIKKIALNASATVPEYGLDGTLTLFTINNKKYVVMGMRRGGHSYYALDITDRTSPKFAWEINASGDFSQLGQTWSKPLRVKMYLSNSNQDVLVFGGGYDEDQDTASSRTTDDQGNAIYIVNPETGALIKRISNSGADINIPDMTNSIASNVLPVDINANGIIDRLYAADVGGRIIRVDIPDSKFTDTTLSGGIIADINSGGTGGFKRFFNTPEVGYFSNSGSQSISILIGSGNRSSPLSSTEIDRFYMIRDNAVWKAPLNDINLNNKWDVGETFDYHNVQAYERKVTVSYSGSLVSVDNNGELYNATNNLIQDGSQQQQLIEKKLLAGEGSIDGTRGWFIDLSTTEKSVTKAVLYDNVVLFTTYSGSASTNVDLCKANTVVGTSRLYAVSMSNGSAKKHLSSNTNSALNKQDRVMELKIEGLPPAVSLTYGTDKTIRAIVGVEKVMELDDNFHAISWETVNE